MPDALSMRPSSCSVGHLRRAAQARDVLQFREDEVQIGLHALEPVLVGDPVDFVDHFLLPARDQLRDHGAEHEQPADGFDNRQDA